jgi:hypothetical protein
MCQWTFILGGNVLLVAGSRFALHFCCRDTISRERVPAAWHGRRDGIAGWRFAFVLGVMCQVTFILGANVPIVTLTNWHIGTLTIWDIN